jgi:O-acetyl-ADP-ribose deacetylase (regulator of RNase III)
MLNRSVEPFEGSITDCPAIIIVNPTNNSFGIARSVSRAIIGIYENSEFEAESQSLLSAYVDKVVPASEIVVAPGKTHQNQWILHAVFSDKHSVSHATNRHLVYEVMFNILLAADALAVKHGIPNVTLGLPLYGCEDFEFYYWGNIFPIIRDAILNYFKQYHSSTVSRIYLVHPDKQVCLIMLKELVYCAQYI